MKKTDMDLMLTIDEQVLCQMLEGTGKIHVRIDRLGKYFVPYVFFSEADDDEIKPRGVIVRNNYLLGAETMEDVLSVLRNIAGDVSAVHINTIPRADGNSNLLQGINNILRMRIALANMLYPFNDFVR